MLHHIKSLPKKVRCCSCSIAIHNHGNELQLITGQLVYLCFYSLDFFTSMTDTLQAQGIYTSYLLAEIISHVLLNICITLDTRNCNVLFCIDSLKCSFVSKDQKDWNEKTFFHFITFCTLPSNNGKLLPLWWCKHAVVQNQKQPTELLIL